MVEDPTGFEREFNFPSTSIVRFPMNMGITGFAYQNDAINYFNKLNIELKKKDVTEHNSQCYTIGQNIFSQPARLLFQARIAESNPYNAKIDNFVNVSQVNNLVICSIQGDEVVGSTSPVGILQIYNKKVGDITDEDLNRIFYIRKLIGSVLIKCDIVLMTLYVFLGANNDALV